MKKTLASIVVLSLIGIALWYAQRFVLHSSSSYFDLTYRVINLVIFFIVLYAALHKILPAGLRHLVYVHAEPILHAEQAVEKNKQEFGHLQTKFSQLETEFKTEVVKVEGVLAAEKKEKIVQTHAKAKLLIAQGEEGAALAEKDLDTKVKQLYADKLLQEVRQSLAAKNLPLTNKTLEEFIQKV